MKSKIWRLNKGTVLKFLEDSENHVRIFQNFHSAIEKRVLRFWPKQNLICFIFLLGYHVIIFLVIFYKAIRIIKIVLIALSDSNFVKFFTINEEIHIFTHITIILFLVTRISRYLQKIKYKNNKNLWKYIRFINDKNSTKSCIQIKWINWILEKNKVFNNF